MANKDLKRYVEDTIESLEIDVEKMIIQFRDDVKKMGTVDLAFMQNFIRKLKDAIDKFEKPINIFYDFLRMNILPEVMDAEGVQTVKITDLGTLYITSDVGVTVIKGKQEDSKKWLRDNKLGDIIKEVVNASTLKASMKVEMEKGTKIPEDIYKLTPMSRAVIKKS